MKHALKEKDKHRTFLLPFFQGSSGDKKKEDTLVSGSSGQNYETI